MGARRVNGSPAAEELRDPSAQGERTASDSARREPLLDPAGRRLRCPRSLLNHPQSEALLVSLGVEIVDHDVELEEIARVWLAQQDGIDTPATRAVKRRLAA